MRIVIDGYNVLKRGGRAQDIDEHAHSNFIAHLTRYAKKKGHSIMVIFDGGPYQWPFTEQIKGVTVVYSGERMSADEYIQEYISKRANSQMLLVTSDRALNEWADNYGVHSLDSHYFASFLYPETSDKISVTSQAVKLSSEDNRELDELMKEIVPVVKQQEARILKEKEARLPKRERTMMEILKKL